MNILCFDTCFNKSYIVLSQNEKILKSKIIESDDRNYHSAYLISEIRNILADCNLFIKDLEAIGINTGPGSFTGVRAGVTIARVFCQQFNIKLLGISSLEILSYLNKEKTHTTVISDARKNKVYFGEYESGIEITAPCLKEKDELLSCIKKNSTVISDNSLYNFLSENGIKSLQYELSNENFALYLNSIVQNRLKQSIDDYNWAKVKPLYLQKPSISKPKEKINVL